MIRSPPYFASKADIWRYAVMYTYGGMYIDDDSDIRFPLDDVSQSTHSSRCISFRRQSHLICYSFLVPRTTTTPA